MPASKKGFFFLEVEEEEKNSNRPDLTSSGISSAAATLSMSSLEGSGGADSSGRTDP